MSVHRTLTVHRTHSITIIVTLRRTTQVVGGLPIHIMRVTSLTSFLFLNATRHIRPNRLIGTFRLGLRNVKNILRTFRRSSRVVRLANLLLLFVNDVSSAKRSTLFRSVVETTRFWTRNTLSGTYDCTTSFCYYSSTSRTRFFIVKSYILIISVVNNNWYVDNVSVINNVV